MRAATGLTRYRTGELGVDRSE